MAGRLGSVSGPSPAEPKYLSEVSEKWIRLVLYVSGRETCVFGEKAVSCVRTTNLPPEGGDLPEVIPRGRRGEKLSGHNYSSRSKEPEQPPGGRASGEAGGRTRPADSRREAVGRPARPSEGGPDGDDRPDPAGRSRGGRGAGTEYPGAVAGPVSVSRPAFEVRGEDVPTDGWDSPPGRFGIYHDLDAGEGQHHE
jgi:hypothetical protein